MRMLIVGAGSTGGYFGGRLAQAGRDVAFLVRPARAARLRAAGLEIISPHGGVTLHPEFVTAGGIAAPFDAVLLTVKAFSLDAAMDDLAPAVGSATMILPVLNGMRHMDLLAARFGKDAVIGCACKVATMLDNQGRIVQLSPLQELAYGELAGAWWRGRPPPPPASSTPSCGEPASMRGCRPRSDARCGRNGSCSPPWGASTA